MTLALLTGADREFSAARASFLAWNGAEVNSRLVTTARTRQQRASRAFAAELLAPAAFLKKRLGKERDVSPFTLDRISTEIGVASTIVRLQDENNHYKIFRCSLKGPAKAVLSVFVLCCWKRPPTEAAVFFVQAVMA